MKLNIAICDDEQIQIDNLNKMVSEWAMSEGVAVNMRSFHSAESFMFEYSENKSFDILLLDIEMSGMNGIELAKLIRKDNSTIQIVFITGYYEYFSDGYDVSALHYLIKPTDKRKLFPVLNRAMENLMYRQRSILLTSTDGDVKMSLADIVYIEAENVYINVYTTYEKIRIRMSLSKFSEKLDDTFFKVHRSYIVSLKYIKRVTRKDVIMINSDMVPLSRGMYNNVHEALVKYL